MLVSRYIKYLVSVILALSTESRVDFINPVAQSTNVLTPRIFINKVVKKLEVIPKF